MPPKALFSAKVAYSDKNAKLFTAKVVVSDLAKPRTFVPHENIVRYPLSPSNIKGLKTNYKTSTISVEGHVHERLEVASVQDHITDRLHSVPVVIVRSPVQLIGQRAK